MIPYGYSLIPYGISTRKILPCNNVALKSHKSVKSNAKKKKLQQQRYIEILRPSGEIISVNSQSINGDWWYNFASFSTMIKVIWMAWNVQSGNIALHNSLTYQRTISNPRKTSVKCLTIALINKHSSNWLL